eukprot:546834-Rhodomonas_salina.1
MEGRGSLKKELEGDRGRLSPANTTGSDQLDHPSSINSDDASFNEPIVLSSLDGVRDCLADLTSFAKSGKTGATPEEHERFIANIHFKVDMVCSKDAFANLLQRLESNGSDLHDFQAGSDNDLERRSERSTSDKFSENEKEAHEEFLSSEVANMESSAHVQENELSSSLFEFFGQDHGTEIYEIDGKQSPRESTLAQNELDREYDIDLEDFDILLGSNKKSGGHGQRESQQTTATLLDRSATDGPSPMASGASAMSYNQYAYDSRYQMSQESRQALEQEPMSNGVLRLKDEIHELSMSVEAFLSPEHASEKKSAARARSLSPVPSRAFSLSPATDSTGNNMSSSSAAAPLARAGFSP